MTTKTRQTDISAPDVVSRARDVAVQVLRPSALDVDRRGVPVGHIAALAAAGLLNAGADPEFGGSGGDSATDRALGEILAGADPNTWLIWTQHAPQVTRLNAARRAGADLPDIAYEILRGERLAGAALSDVRRYPDRYIRATRDGRGWRFDGTVSWVSGWGLNSVLTVAAVDPDTDQVVTAFIPVGEDLPGIRAEPLDLAALSGSRTARVELTGVEVPEENVLSVESHDRWQFGDTGTATDAKPHHFGLATAVLDELAAEKDPEARAVAGAWRPVVERIRNLAYELTDAAAEQTVTDQVAGTTAPYHLAERLELKVAATRALSELTDALLAARSGHGIGFDDTAQLYARTALFIEIQGQNSDVRSAQLRSYSRIPASVTDALNDAAAPTIPTLRSE
jgi:alkylation response protein AidB-like acyl-CoA dehydrogenase